MNMRWTNYSLFAAAMAVLSVVAIAGQGRPVAKTAKGGESGLVGIKLYDNGTRVISVYGNPTEIQPVSFGGGGIGPAGGAGGGAMGAGRAGGPPSPRSGGGGGGGRVGGNNSGASDAFHSPGGDFGFGDELLFQKGGPGGDLGGPMGPGASAPGMMAPGGGRPGMGGQMGAPAGGGGMMGGGETGNKVLYTRWIYKRGPSKYGFILDKFNRVVQVEAIGMNDPKVRTSKGIKFGSTFGEVMNKYQTPDGYEINGDSIVLRYLVRNKVAFRLSRLAEKKPHVVTGVVVAGGKT